MDIHEINYQIAKNLQNQLDDLIIEGLKRKGYTFQDKNLLYDFAKKYFW